MSQRTNAGFNAPGFAVGAGDEVEGVPEAGAIALAASAANAPPAWFGPPFEPSVACSVFQPASIATSFSCLPLPTRRLRPFFFPPFAIGVGHPEKPLPDVRRADTRSRQIGGPDGISQVLQVSAYSSEPFAAILACNLLSKDDWRAALGDEAVKSGPEVSLVGMALAVSSARKRLTGTGAGPDGPVGGPAGKGKGERPAADAGEEVALLEADEVGCPNIDN